jgi:hypothetical protein
MKHKTWFRLVIKAIGLLFVGMSIPHITSMLVAVVQMLQYYTNAGTALGPQMWYYYGSLVGGLLEFALGLYLFFGGAWIVNKCIPSNRPYCPECGVTLPGRTNSNTT